MTVLAAMAAVPLVPVVCWMIDAVTGGRVSRWRVSVILPAAVAVAAATWPGGAVTSVAAVAMAALGVTLAFVDMACRRLPDVLVLTAYPAVGAVLIVAGVVSGEPDRLLRAGMAAAVSLTGLGVLAAVGGFGFGDAKLAGLLGLLLGWSSWTAVLAAGVLTAGLAVVPALAAWSRWGRRARFAFGPPLLLGALFAASW